jgi:hypothetical protein
LIFLNKQRNPTYISKQSLFAGIRLFQSERDKLSGGLEKGRPVPMTGHGLVTIRQKTVHEEIIGNRL